MIVMIIVLLFSVIVHEYMHAWAANHLGDTTAKDAGRLTLNPIPHLDPVGSILLPAILILSKAGMIFGYAKPVPVNFNNLSDKKYGMAKVAIAGPLGNLMLAILAGLALRLLIGLGVLSSTNSIVTTCLALTVWINLLLMLFNLVPIPPLDGSKILMTFLSPDWQKKMAKLENYGMLLILLFIVFAFPVISVMVEFLFKLIVGM